MDRSTAQTWLDAYVAAWKSYDRAAVEALFAEDATYRYHPFDPEDETLRGREAIVSSWLQPEGNASGRDAAGTYDARYEVYAVDGDRVVAVGWSSYFSDASQSTLERRSRTPDGLTSDPAAPAPGHFRRARPRAKTLGPAEAPSMTGRLLRAPEVAEPLGLSPSTAPTGSRRAGCPLPARRQGRAGQVP